MNRVDYEKMGLNSVKVEEIMNEFNELKETDIGTPSLIVELKMLLKNF